MNERALSEGIAAIADGLIRYEKEIDRLCALNAELVAALEPFAVKDKVSLTETLGHVEREHIEKARAVIAKVRGES